MKYTIYISKYLRGAAFGLALLSVGFTPPLMQSAVAASSFVYNPVPYDTVSGDFVVGNQPSGAFTTNMDLNEANFPGITTMLVDISSALTSINFSDGATTNSVTYTNPALLGDGGDVSSFEVATDAFGNISQWLIDLGNAPPELGLADQVTIPGQGQFALHVNESEASSVLSGTWSIAATTPAPELSTSLAGLLSVVLLGGLLIRNKSLKV